jgi:hypothetical protein
MANNELRTVREAAVGGSNTVTERAQVERPKNIKNLQVAMSISHATYLEFCVSPLTFFILTSVLELISYLL